MHGQHQIEHCRRCEAVGTGCWCRESDSVGVLLNGTSIMGPAVSSCLSHRAVLSNRWMIWCSRDRIWHRECGLLGTIDAYILSHYVCNLHASHAAEAGIIFSNVRPRVLITDQKSMLLSLNICYPDLWPQRRAILNFLMTKIAYNLKRQLPVTFWWDFACTQPNTCSYETADFGITILRRL